MGINLARSRFFQTRWAAKLAAKRRRFRDADIRFYGYICPEGSRFHRVKVEGCDVETIVTSTAGRVTFRPSSCVTVGSNTGASKQAIIGVPPPGFIGSSSFPVLTSESSLDVFKVISADPFFVEPGVTGQAVVLTGVNFRSAPVDLFEAVVWNAVTMVYDLDPFVTIQAPAVFVDSETVNILEDVLATAPLEHKIAVRVTRQ